MPDASLAKLVRDTVAEFIPGGEAKPLWLLDETFSMAWPDSKVFSQPDYHFLDFVDAPVMYFLLCGQRNLRALLPLIDRILLVHAPLPEYDASSDATENNGNPDLFCQLPELAKAGFVPIEPGQPAFAGWCEILQRPSAAALIAGLMDQGDCDLHLHTNKSDGTDSPEQLVDRVLDSGLRAFAITDHDNLAALEPARAWLEKRCANENCRPIFVPGVELSIDDQRELHLLGYFPRGGTEIIEGFLIGQRQARRERNRKMIRKLQKMGYKIAFKDLEASGEGTVGRLQAALILRDRGYFATIPDAFNKLLGYGRPAYFERSRQSPAEAIWLIRKAGGVAVLAHPGLYGWCSGRAVVAGNLLIRLEKLKQLGLQGVEAFHGEAPAACQLEISAAARVVGLIRTGGSDDHGINKEHAHLFTKGTHWLACPEILVTAALVNGPPRGGQPTWLLARRSSPGSGNGCWEFPGGKVEPGETAAEALRREIKEELSVSATIADRLMVLTYAYPERRVILIGMETRLENENWQLSVHDDIRYATAQEALGLNLLPADVLFFEAMLGQAEPAN